MNQKDLAKYLDFANHHQDATAEDIKKLCQKVKKHHFHSAFVNPCYLNLARECLGESEIVGTVVAFPLGQESQNVKILAAIDAARKGANELDICINVGLFKSGKKDQVLEEMKAIVEAAKNIKKNILIKFIIETSLLKEEEIKKAAQLVLESGADFVKTNSGWGPRGASLKDVDLIKQAVEKKIKIKVAGGVDTYQEAIGFINQGADRIGTSQAVKIVEGAKK